MKAFLFILLTYLSNLLMAQDSVFSRLKMELEASKDDTTKVLLMTSLAGRYSFFQFDSSITYFRRALELSQQINYLYGQYEAYNSMFFAFNNTGDYAKTLETKIEALKIAERLQNRRIVAIAGIHQGMSFIYREMELYDEGLNQYRIVMKMVRDAGLPMVNYANTIGTAAQCYIGLGKPDSALICANIQDSLDRKFKRTNLFTFLNYGRIQEGLGNYRLAEKNFRDALKAWVRGELNDPGHDNQYFLAGIYNALASALSNSKQYDSSFHYSMLALEISRKKNFLHYELQAAKILSQNYAALHKPDSVVKYLHEIIATNDSIFSQNKLRQFQLMGFSEEQRQKEIEAANERFRNKVRLYALVAALAVFLIVAAMLYRNNRQKQKANTLLNHQKLEIESALSTLKSTQRQLVQSEKMASLGELTAGIAHEIQNPLNFVNNFSEVNEELVDEMENEIKDGQSGRALELASNIRKNMEKINEHGKRADAIVKGMLQHSRTDAGQKEATDINSLAEEYLRLSFHSMRGRDQAFTCEVKTQFDGSIGKIPIVRQDIGRVLLNVYNNAFYSVAEKRKKSVGLFEPMLSIYTKKLDHSVEIRFRDNGMGIPNKISDKIFQPFFTTKPTGQGTGLGLSVAYDIIVNEHGGSLTLVNEEGNFAEFVLRIPTTQLT